MHVKFLAPLFCTSLSLPLVAAANSHLSIAHKAILDLELARTQVKAAIAALPSQARP